jgi:hypothetical protein
VALAVLVLVAGVAIAEEPVKEEAAPAEKQSEEMAEAEAAETAEAEAAETAEAEQSEKMAEAEDAESDEAEPSEEMTEAKAAEPAKAKTAKAKTAKPAEKKMSKASAKGMAVSQIAICESVQERVPVGESDSFPTEVGQLWCFTRVQNADPPTQIFHRWYIGEQLVQEIAINVKGNHWRCWSSKTIDPSWTGDCRVEILTEEGDVISTKSFVLGG